MGTIIIAANTSAAQWSAALALAVMAGLLFLAARLSIQRIANTRHWPTVAGVVVESAVAASSNGRRQLYRPVVRYHYEVDGERYEGSRIGWDAISGFRKFTRARRMLDGYRPGHTVAVYHDPLRPALSVLRPEAAAGLRPMLLVAPTACALLIVCAFVAF